MKVRIKSLPKAASGLELKLNSALGQNHKAMPWPGGPSRLSDDDADVRNTLKPVPREEATLEAEKGEVVVTPGEGGIPMSFTIGGKRHSGGGTPLKLPSDSFIYSDTKDMRIKDPNIISQFGMPPVKGGYTPAIIAKKYNINNFLKILKDPDTDELQKKTAEGMIANYNLKLAKLALIQESMKGFPTGIPKVALPYVEQMNIKPDQFFAQNGQQDTEEPGQEMPMNPDMGEGKYGANVINNLIMHKYGGLYKAQGGFGGIGKNGKTMFSQPGMASTQSLFGDNKGYLGEGDGSGTFNWDITQTNKRKYDGESMANWGLAGMEALTNVFNWDEQASARRNQESLYGADNNFLAQQGNRGMWDQFGNARPDQHNDVQFSGNAEMPATKYGGTGTMKVRITGLPKAQNGIGIGNPIQYLIQKYAENKAQEQYDRTHKSVFDHTDETSERPNDFIRKDGKLVSNPNAIGRNIPLLDHHDVLFDAVDILVGGVASLRTSIGKPIEKTLGKIIASGFKKNPNITKNSMWAADAIADAENIVEKVVKNPVSKKIVKTPYILQPKYRTVPGKGGSHLSTPSFYDYLNAFKAEIGDATLAGTNAIGNTIGKGVVKTVKGIGKEVIPFAKASTVIGTVTSPWWAENAYNAFSDQSLGPYNSPNSGGYNSPVTTTPVTTTPVDISFFNKIPKKETGGELTQFGKAGDTKLHSKYNPADKLIYFTQGDRKWVKDLNGKIVYDTANQTAQAPVNAPDSNGGFTNILNAKRPTGLGFPAGFASQDVYNAYLAGKSGNVASPANATGTTAGTTKGTGTKGTTGTGSGTTTAGSIPAYGDKAAWLKEHAIEGSVPLTADQVIKSQHASKKGYGEQGTYEDWEASNPRFMLNWKNSHGDEKFDINNKAHLKEYDEFYNWDTYNGVWAQAKQDFINKGDSEAVADKKATDLAEEIVKNIGFKGAKGTLNAADQQYGDYYRGRKEIQFKDLKAPEVKDDATKKDDVPVKENAPIYPEGNAPWWLQDIIKTAGATGDFMRVKKYNPWQQDPNVHLPEVNMYDPTRELAASSEQTQQGVQGLQNFYGPQSFNANFNEMQGQGFRNAADIMSKYNNQNVGVANAHESEVAGILNNAEVARAAGHTQLYDKYNIANQQFDNAKNQARQNLRQSYIDAITNRAKAQALNSVYENYQVDPSSGGYINMPHGRPVNPSPYDDGMAKARYASDFYEKFPHLRGNKAAEDYIFGTNTKNQVTEEDNPFDEKQQILKNFAYAYGGGYR